MAKALPAISRGAAVAIAVIVIVVVIGVAAWLATQQPAAPAATPTPAPSPSPSPTPTATPSPTPTPTPTATATQTAAAPQFAGTIKIGTTVSLQGKFAHEGKLALCGFKVAVKWVNEHGGVVVNGKRYKLQLIYYDDKSDKTEVQKLITKLITQDKVDFLIAPYSSSLTLAAVPIAEQYHKSF